MSFATTHRSGAGTGGSNSQDNMNNIAEMIRIDPSIRQMFIDIATQRDPALGQQLTQSLRLLDVVTRTAGPQGANGQLSVTLAREEKKAIQRITDLGFEKKQALVAYLVSDKNEKRATNELVKNNSKNSVDLKNAKATITPAIGQLISDNRSFRLGLNEFIAQNEPALAQQIKENPALLKAALQIVFGGDGTGSLPVGHETPVIETQPLSVRTGQNTNSPSQQIKENPEASLQCGGTVGGGAHIGSTPSLPVDRERQVIETRPLSESARTGQKTNSPSKQIKENPAFSKASLQSAGTVEGGAGIGLTHSLPGDRERRVIETQPVSAKTSQKTNSPSQQIKENPEASLQSGGTVGVGARIGSTHSLPVDRERQVIETRPPPESARTGQKTNLPSKQIKENPAFSEASLQSTGTVGGGPGIGSTHSLPVDRERRVIETQPVSAKTSQKTNSPSQQIKENPEASLQSGGTAGSGASIGSTHSLPIDRERGVTETRPFSAKTSQKTNSPSQQIKENPDASVQSAGTVGSGAGIGLTHSLPVDHERWVIENQPLSSKTSQNTNSPSQQIKENLEASLQSAGGAGIGSTHSLPVDRERQVIETRPLSAKTSQNTNSPNQQIKENPEVSLQSAGSAGIAGSTYSLPVDRERRVIETRPLSAKTGQNTNSPSQQIKEKPEASLQGAGGAGIGSLPIYHEMGVIETQLSAKSARTGQKMNSPSQLIKEKPALFEESLQSAGTVGGSARIGSTHSLPVDRDRKVMEPRALSAKTSQNTSSPSQQIKENPKAPLQSTGTVGSGAGLTHSLPGDQERPVIETRPSSAKTGQKTNSPNKQIKENPELLEASLQSAGTVGGGARIGLTHSLPVDRERGVIETQPSSSKTSQKTNLPSQQINQNPALFEAALQSTGSVGGGDGTGSLPADRKMGVIKTQPLSAKTGQKTNSPSQQIQENPALFEESFQSADTIGGGDGTVVGLTRSLPGDRERQVIETRPSSAKTGQKTNSPSKQIKENPALFEASLQSAGTVGGGAGIGSTDSLPVDRERRVIETRSSSAKTGQKTNLSSQQIKQNPALFETSLQSTGSVGDGDGTGSLPVDRERRVIETQPLSASTGQNANSPTKQIKENPTLFESALQSARTVVDSIGTHSLPVDRERPVIETLPLSARTGQNPNSPTEKIKDNPALFEGALQSAGTVVGGDGTGSTHSLPIDYERRVIETLPLSARTSQTSPSFHVIKLPALAGNINHLRHLVVEFCIQPLGTVERQAIWWTSYVIISHKGTLTRGSGVYTEWDEFGKVLSHPPTGIIAPRTSGIHIADISKGVLNGNQTNGTVLRVVDLRDIEKNIEIFVVLVASGMHDGAYQAHGQATLEYRILSL